MKPQKRAQNIASRSLSTVPGNELTSISFKRFGRSIGRSNLWEKAKSVDFERVND